MREIKAGVLQDSILGPILYLLYTCDIPQTENVVIATFAGDKAILAIGNNSEEAARKLQQASNNVNIWNKKWGIKINKSKSVHIDFVYKKH